MPTFKHPPVADITRDKYVEAINLLLAPAGLTANHVVEDGLKFGGDVLTVEHVVPEPGHEDDDFPPAVQAPTPDDEFAVLTQTSYIRVVDGESK